MSPKSVNVKYTGDNPCWTPAPAADWEPGEVKPLSQEDAAFLLTNEMFKEFTAAVAPAPAPVTTEVNVSG